MGEVYVELMNGKLFKCTSIEPIMEGLIGLINTQAYDFSAKKFKVLSTESMLVFPLHFIRQMEIRIELKRPEKPLSDFSEVTKDESKDSNKQPD